MNFSNFTKNSSGNLIYLKNKSPIESVGSIKFYRDDSSGNFLKKEMRWSFDRDHWSSWMDLNIKNIAGIKTGDNKYLFFEIKYTMTSPTAGKVSTFSVEYLLNPGQTYVPVKDVSLDHSHVIPNGCNDLGKIVKEVIKVTDAQTLCGKSCDFYLWRPNQKGEQPITSITDLDEILSNLDTNLKNVPSYAYVDGSVGLAIQNFATNASVNTALTNYYTKTYIDNSLNKFLAFAQNPSVNATSATTMQTNISLADNSILAGTYRVGWSLWLTNSTNSRYSLYRIAVDGSTLGFDQILFNPGNTYLNAGGFDYANLSAGNHTFTLAWCACTNTATIKNARLEVFKI